MSWDEKQRQLSCRGMAIHKNKIWFYNYRFGAIIEMDMGDMVPHVLWIEESDHFFENDMYGGAAWYKNKLIFSPRCAATILIYDVQTGETKRISFDRSKTQTGTTQNIFTDVQIVGESAYFFPGRYLAILKLNLETYEISYIEGWAEKLGEMPNPESVISPGGKMIDSDTYLLPIWQKQHILEIHFQSGRWHIYETKIRRPLDIGFDGKYIWISFYSNHQIVQWNLHGNAKECFYINIENAKPEEGYYRIFGSQNKVYLLTRNGEMICMDSTTHVQKRKKFCTKSVSVGMQDINPSNTRVFALKKEENGKVYVFDGIAGEFEIIDLRNEKVEQYAAVLSEKELWKKFGKMYQKKMQNFMHEHYEFDLNDYLQMIKNHHIDVTIQIF